MNSNELSMPMHDIKTNQWESNKRRLMLLKYATTVIPLLNWMVEVENIMTLKHPAGNPMHYTDKYILQAPVYAWH